MAVSKIKITKAVGALIAAGMPAATARNAVRLLDLSKAIGPQITALAEEDPELFGLDADGNAPEDDEPDEDERPMTADEAKRARLLGGHRLTPDRPEGCPAQRLAAALGATNTRPERPSTAPATAQAAAQRLRTGIGNSADR